MLPINALREKGNHQFLFSFSFSFLLPLLPFKETSAALWGVFV